MFTELIHFRGSVWRNSVCAGGGQLRLGFGLRARGLARQLGTRCQAELARYGDNLVLRSCIRGQGPLSAAA